MQQRTASTSNNPVPPSSYPNQLRSAPGTVGFNSTPFQDPYQFPQVQPIPVGYNSPLQDPRQNPAAANIATRVAVANNLYPTPGPPAPVSRVSSSSTSRTEGSDRNHTVEYYKLVPMSADDVNEQSPSSYHQSNAEPCEFRQEIMTTTTSTHGSTGGGNTSRRSNSEVVQPMATTSVSRLPSMSQTESARGHQWGRSNDLTAYTTQSSNQMFPNPSVAYGAHLFPGASHVSIQDTTINVIGGNMATLAPRVRVNDQVDYMDPSGQVKKTPNPVELSKALPQIPVSGPEQKQGYPSLKPFTGTIGNQWVLRHDIERHIPIYMSLRPFEGNLRAMPLWYPQPLLTRSNGERRGIEVGDLVYDNKNDGTTPPPESQYRHFPAAQLPHNSPYSSWSTQTRSMYCFKSVKSITQAGIIVAPQGVRHIFLGNEFFRGDEAKEYFCKYSPFWYQHLKRIHPKFENGSLLFVTEAYFTKTWGIATFVAEKPTKGHISIEFREIGRNSNNFSWEHSDSRWVTSTGTCPSTNAGKLESGTPSTQCIGIVLRSLSLDNKTWGQYFDRSLTPSASMLEGEMLYQTSPRADASSSKSHTSPTQSIKTAWTKISPKIFQRTNSDQGSTVETGSVEQSLRVVEGKYQYHDYSIFEEEARR
ncbi:hypothetical protein CPB84DRAFT_1775402 [Gymnopilus junonius]|uniref:Uncharacterized protein n=1 Tax=Gymnopilus junonius TaxID=109634 RepID=A0A9P5NQ80_GYMJU|nr:hypothetical protein CPB84DRAFT_1775402 [Gymnopilus junonius]